MNPNITEDIIVYPEGNMMRAEVYGEKRLRATAKAPFITRINEDVILNVKNYPEPVILITNEIYKVRTDQGITLCYLLTTPGPGKDETNAVSVFKFSDGTKHMICEPYDDDLIKKHRERVRRYTFKQVYGTEEGLD